MQEIEQYAIFWRPEDNAGSLHLVLADGNGADLPLDSASEADFLLDLLRHEKPCFYDSEHRLVSSGLELVGHDEAEVYAKPKKKGTKR